ncbi:Peptidase S41 family protein ustP [Psilocybe cubensis]|uniref:Tail specific protease domain-containing protein n=2 Tax=Psilocybe cubensis TaxID=181762 RepID=A0A8H7XQA0_PSICU|nr:Peptidase S41 family protein ustP [Psilocybe cubensis]KAH9478024.1 Peptidase S41 family protein ustP [Psilocybe cubensis]
MIFLHRLRAYLLLASLIASATATTAARDPCAVIGGQKWVAPKDLRACFTSVKVDPVIKDNIIQVINKTLGFHTSVNYEFKAPEPFTADVHEDLLGDLARIQKQNYPSDYDLHIDFSRTLKRLNDGHCVWVNNCYVTLFLNFLPTPLALLTEADGSQNVHIAPEAFTVASAEFPDQIDVWQNALPGPLKGKLSTLSGAKVLQINGQDPFVAVNANALITGSFQALGTRQNSFFSSYQRSTTGWNYVMGNFAQQSLPLSDSVTLTIVRVNHTLPEVVVLPYRARIGSATHNFTDTASWRANNCVAIDGTNGVDAYASSSTTNSVNTPLIKFQQQPPVPAAVSRKRAVNVMLDTSPPSDVVLPPGLQPSLPAINGSRSVSQFYMLKDGKTGVMALGSFSDSDFNTFLLGMLQGLLSLKSLGATQLIVDVSNNGGGFICAAHWLHRIIAGPKSTTIPQAGLDTKARDGPLAQLIVKQIVNANADPQDLLMYNPVNWANASNIFFAPGTDWLQPPVNTVINGRADAFSQRLGEECSPDSFPTAPPDQALFDPKKVVIVSNGRCASSCSLFSVTMNKKEGSKTVVLGGKKDVQQQYCGTVGGQSTDFSTMDTEVKTTHLKNNSLAPPDLLVNGVQGITWRLGFGVNDPTQPEEWQARPADLNLPITADIVNNPVAIWEIVAKKLLQ